MALFRSVFRQLFECFPHFLPRRETPLRAQQCAAQERAALEKFPEALLAKVAENEAFDFTAKNRKRRKRHRQYGEKDKERQVKKWVKKEREMKRLENLMEGESEQREAVKKEKKKRKLKEQKNTEPTPHLVEVKPQQALVSSPVRSSFLKLIEGELPVLQSVSKDLPLPAAHFRPLPPVTKCPQNPDPAPEDVSLPCSPLHVDPPKPLAGAPRPTPASDVQFSLWRSQVSPSKQLVLPLNPALEVVDLPCSSYQVCPPSPVEPHPSISSMFELPPQLMLIDLEDEETEYVEYTGKTYQACDLHKSESPRLLEAEMKPRKMIAWLESDSKVLEEVWVSEVVEVQEYKEEKGNPEKMGDSKAIEVHLDDASQKKKELDEHIMKLFRVTSPESPKNKTQNSVNFQEEPQNKRKVPLFLFTWAEKKAKKKEDKKIRKEKEQREKELLIEHYRNNPKLKHFLINKHNRHYCSSE